MIREGIPVILRSGGLFCKAAQLAYGAAENWVNGQNVTVMHVEILHPGYLTLVVASMSEKCPKTEWKPSKTAVK